MRTRRRRRARARRSRRDVREWTRWPCGAGVTRCDAGPLSQGRSRPRYCNADHVAWRRRLRERYGHSGGVAPRLNASSRSALQAFLLASLAAASSERTFLSCGMSGYFRASSLILSDASPKRSDARSYSPFDVCVLPSSMSSRIGCTSASAASAGIGANFGVLPAVFALSAAAILLRLSARATLSLYVASADCAAFAVDSAFAVESTTAPAATVFFAACCCCQYQNPPPPAASRTKSAAKSGALLLLSSSSRTGSVTSCVPPDMNVDDAVGRRAGAGAG